MCTVPAIPSRPRRRAPAHVPGWALGLVTAALAAVAPGCDDAPPSLGGSVRAPDDELLPQPGELFILHPNLAGPAGDATVIVGPDGTIALVDVGCAEHSGAVRALVERLDRELLTPERGYPARRAPRQVEHVLFTHFHTDHIGAAGELLGGYDQLDVRGLIVFRGWVEPAWSEAYVRFCESAEVFYPDQIAALCTSADGPAPCHPDGLSHATAACPGLARGDLTDEADDAAGATSWLPLGGGARLYIAGVDGFFGDDRFAGNLAENGRSLVGLVTYGGFRYHFGGDLTGGGTDLDGVTVTNDAEGVFLAAAGALAGVGGDGPLYDARGVDVLHAHHHGLESSNQEPLLDALLPADGRARNVVVGIGSGYGLAPSAAFYDRLGGGRLSGGGIWQTGDPHGDVSSDLLVVARGAVAIRTGGRGAGYWIQALFDDDPTDGLTAAYLSVH